MHEYASVLQLSLNKCNVFQKVEALSTYSVAQKSKPLSLIIIKSYSNPLWMLDISSVLIRKWEQVYNKSDLIILCVT